MAMEPTSNTNSPERSESGEMEISDEIYTDKALFLEAVHKPFLKDVYNVAALMDEFRSERAMSSGEESQVLAETTRRDKARKLWTFLKSDRVSSKSFHEIFYPAMKSRYPLVFEGKKFVMDPQEEVTVPCIQHAIMKRIPLKRFADLFPHVHGCSDEHYRQLTECPPDDQKWNLAFSLCMQLDQEKRNGQFVTELKELLERYGIVVADATALSGTIVAGFPCQCPCEMPVHHAKSPMALKAPEGCGKSHCKRHAEFAVEIPGSLKQLRWMSYHELSSGYPASTMDSEEQFSSILSSQVIAATVEEGTAGKLEFSTREEKDSLFEEMEKLNRATSAASEIRPLFRKLDGMKDKMKILMTVAKCEGKQSTDDLEKIRQLKQEAKKVYLLLEKNFDSASHVKNSFVSEPNGVLLKKQQMLKNELLEATPFYQKAHSVHQEIQTQDALARQNQQRICNEILCQTILLTIRVANTAVTVRPSSFTSKSCRE